MYFSFVLLTIIVNSVCPVTRTASTPQEPTQIVTCDGYGISYTISIPPQCVTTACGMIFDIHGANGTPEVINALTGIRAKGNSAGFITANPHRIGHVTWTNLDASAAQLELDIRDLVAKLGVDTNKVHVTGFSQGGYLTWATLCRASDLIASIAPLASSGHDGWKNLFNGQSVSNCWSARGPTNPRAVMYHSGVFDPFYLSTIVEASIQVSRVNTWLGPSAHDFETNAHWLSNGLFSVTQGHCVPNPVVLSQQEAAAAGIPAQDYHGLYQGQTCVYGDVYDWGQQVVDFFVSHAKDAPVIGAFVIQDPLPSQQLADPAHCWEGKTITYGTQSFTRTDGNTCETLCAINLSCFGWVERQENECYLRLLEASLPSLSEVENSIQDDTLAVKACAFYERMTGTESVEYAMVVAGNEVILFPDDEVPENTVKVETKDEGDDSLAIALIVVIFILVIVALFWFVRWLRLKETVQQNMDEELEFKIDEMHTNNLGDNLDSNMLALGPTMESTSMCKQPTPMLEDEWGTSFVNNSSVDAQYLNAGSNI